MSVVHLNRHHQVESIKVSTVQRQQQLDSEAAALQRQEAELNQRVRDFQARVVQAEAALQEREAALGDLQVWRQHHQQLTWRSCSCTRMVGQETARVCPWTHSLCPALGVGCCRPLHAHMQPVRLSSIPGRQGLKQHSSSWSSSHSSCRCVLQRPGLTCLACNFHFHTNLVDTRAVWRLQLSACAIFMRCCSFTGLLLLLSSNAGAAG